MSNSKENESLLKKYKEICSDLNMNKSASDEALLSFNRIGNNYSLEGQKLHWLCCALYVACRKGLTPTVGRSSYVEGNFVSLTRLLKLCNLSLVQFFIMMKKWADMANLSQDMRNKIDYFERNFNVTTIIFKKYRPIFLAVFKDPSTSQSRQSKSKKQKARSLVSSNDIFTFCWTLFIQVKSNFADISADLVNSYHLLIACIDFCYNNILFTEYAKEILNPNFSELPENFFQDDYIMPENTNCIISALCEQFQGIQVDAKGIKEHWWKPYIKRLVERKILKCRNVDQLIGFLDTSVFEHNQKSINKEYETFVLGIGDFDERIFLYDTAQTEIGTPSNDQSDTNHLSQQLNQIKNHIDEGRSLAPCTPLSNRHYLNNRDLGAQTPVSNATHTVSRLQSLLIGFKDQPSANLLTIFEKCSENPTNTIKKRVAKMSECFLAAYTSSDSTTTGNGQLSEQSQDFAKKRLQFSVAFYYKMLENIANREMKITTSDNNSERLAVVLSNEIFHVCLFACSVEIVLFAYKSQKVFPWIIEIFKDYNNLQFQPCDFYKVIELIIRDEEGLSRDIVKHLTSLEERILESMAWRSDSNLWEKIKAQGTIPASQDVSLNSSADPPSTPVSAIKRGNTSQTANDRFNSPVNSSIRRRLFDSTPNGDSQTTTASNSNTQQPQTQQQSIVQLTLPGQEQSTVYYIINKTPQQLAATNSNATTNSETSGNNKESTTTAVQVKQNKFGPLGLFFRKVYQLAWIRLKDLCDRLKIGEDDLLRKIWTCFEYALRNNIHLMKDRHLDQIIMCTIYSMCKITKRSVTFHEIMAEYRFQPHYQSHVYRSILLSNKSSSSENTSANTRSSSATTVEYDQERGDIIMFYNQIYVTEMKKYILKFSADNSSPPLSPLPRKTPNPISPFRNRKVSLTHPVFVSPLKSTNLSSSPIKKHSTYCFSISPANDLKAINQMVKTSNLTYSNSNSTNSFNEILNSNNNGKKVSKRIFQDNDEYSPTKRICSASVNLLSSRLENVFTDREVASDSN